MADDDTATYGKYTVHIFILPATSCEQIMTEMGRDSLTNTIPSNETFP